MTPWDKAKIWSEFLSSVRTFFLKRGFIEVNTPCLARWWSLDPNIRPIKTQEGYFLQTSPEFFMKKLIMFGAKKIFQIAHAFRDDPIDKLHNKEFLILEWYRTDDDIESIRRDVEELVYEILGRFPPPWEKLSLKDLFLKKLGIDLEKNKERDDFLLSLKKAGIRVKDDYTWEDLFECAFITEIEPFLPKNEAFWLIDYPYPLSAASKCKDFWSTRCEAYVEGVELANGYIELDDPEEQLKRWLSRGSKDEIDWEYITLMKEKGLPPCAGIALGLKRLLMLKLQKDDIHEILPFGPLSEGKNKGGKP